MALSTAVITFNVSDMLGIDFDARRTKAWTSTNVDNDTLIDTAANQIRLGDGKAAIGTDGTGSFTVWIPGSGANPLSWQTFFHFDYVQPGTRERKVRTFGPFTLTGNADLADLEAEQAIPATYLSEVSGALAGYVAAAQQAAADAVSISNIGVPDDTVEALVKGTAGAGPKTRAALATSIATTSVAEGRRVFADSHGTYLPTKMAGRKWRRKRAAVLAGLERGHLAFLGDSIPAGAGTAAPKNQASYPGRLRATLEKAGLWGGGLVIASPEVFATPALDPRWTFAGATTLGTAFGFFKTSYQITSGNAANYIEFTDTCDSFVIYLGRNAGQNSIKIDGVDVGTVGNGSTEGTLIKDTGYAPFQLVATIPAGALGQHTIRITPDTAATGRNVILFGIKPVVSGLGKFEVSNCSIGGKSLAGFMLNDETNGLYGLPMLDMLRADLLVCALGINDFLGSRAVAAAQADVASILGRQMGSGAAPPGGVKPNADAMVLWNPQPNTAALLPNANPTWAQYRAGWYVSADAAGVPLLDLGDRWIDFATGNAAGYFYDTIHPNNNGSLDMVTAVHESIFNRI